MTRTDPARASLPFGCGGRLDGIPSLREGETLYSWCSLYHRISGAAFAAVTSERLFGARIKPVVDFPGRIGTLATVTDGLLGSADEIIDRHTLLGLYARFRPSTTVDLARQLMTGNSVERLKVVLGLPASRAANSHPLKFCPQCVFEEVSSAGVARWWVDHQWPTTWSCTRHDALLVCAADWRSALHFTAWIMADDLARGECKPPDAGVARCLPMLNALAELTRKCAASGRYYAPAILRATLLDALRSRGLGYRSGTIRITELRRAFLDRFADLETLPGLEFIRSVGQADFGFLGALIRSSRSRYFHPSKVLLLIALLFDRFETFDALYCQWERHDAEHGLPANLRQLCQERQESEVALKELVEVQGLSINQAASRLGLSVKTAVAVAKRCGIAYRKRPRKLTKSLALSLDEMIHNGESRETISTALGVSKRWITAHFAKNPGKREQWSMSHLEAERSRRREHFIDILKEHNGDTQSEIRRLPGSNFQWLLRNDATWLAEHLPMLKPPVGLTALDRTNAS